MPLFPLQCNPKYNGTAAWQNQNAAVNVTKGETQTQHCALVFLCLICLYESNWPDPTLHNRFQLAQLTSLSTLLCAEYSSGWESLLSRMWRDQGRSQSSGSERCSMARGAGLSKSGSQASQQLKAESLSTDLLDYKQKPTNEKLSPPLMHLPFVANLFLRCEVCGMLCELTEEQQSPGLISGFAYR